MSIDTTAPAVLDLDAIEARVNATTPGPWATDPEMAWRLGGEAHEFVYAPEPADGHGIVALTGIKGGHPTSPADAAFIAAARTDVPALVAEVRRLREQLFAQQPVIDAAQTWAEMCEGGPYNDLRQSEGALHGAVEQYRLMELALASARAEPR